MNKSAFADFAVAYKPRLEKQLAQLLLVAGSTASVPAYTAILKELQILLGRGGKRLRPLLCILAYNGYGGTNRPAILRAAASQELLHAFLLIHDDIIDRDWRRWNGNNISGVYFEHFSKTMTARDALHFAESWALLAGDICATLASTALADSGFAPTLLHQAQRLQQQTTLRVIAGELTDTDFSLRQKPPSEAAVLTMYAHKTASYSFELPLQIGALLAGASAKEQRLLQEIATNIGIAFQLQDDLLGIFGEQQITGKPVLSDVRERKYTLLVVKALKLASSEQRAELLSLLGNESVNMIDLAKAQTIMTSCGARRAVEQQIAGHTKQALELLARTSMHPAAQARLSDLVQGLIGRTH